jgi:hypothetical protein
VENTSAAGGRADIHTAYWDVYTRWSTLAGSTLCEAPSTGDGSVVSPGGYLSTVVLGDMDSGGQPRWSQIIVLKRAVALKRQLQRGGGQGAGARREKAVPSSPSGHRGRPGSPPSGS